MSTDTARPPITPDLKVGELLRCYPEVEEVLLGLSPSFGALKNPVLRRTVAKLATLRQVAKVGGLQLGTLVGCLRAAAGQAPLAADAEAAEAARPAWAAAEHVTCSWDARSLIDAGGHPLEQVPAAVKALGGAQVYELVTPFEPAPLVDLVRRQGFLAHSVLESPTLCRTYFRRA